MPPDHRLKSLLRYWEEKRAARPMPARSDIDPTTMDRDLLPWVALTEVVDGGQRFRFRLCGTGLAEIAGLDLTGRFIDELNPNVTYAEYVMNLYRLAVAWQRPVYSETSYVASAVKPRSTARLICPLSDDGVTVNMCIAGQISKEIGRSIHSSLTYADAFEAGRVEVL